MTTTWSGLLAARAGANLPAVRSAQGDWSTRELVARAAWAADWLDEIGARTDVPVAALVTASPSAIALLVGCAGSARPLAPLGVRFTEHELVACIEPLEANVLVAEQRFLELAKACGDRTGSRVAVVPDLSTSDRPLHLDPAPDSIAYVLHTSGTTGRPKSVPVRQDRLAARTRISAGLMCLGPGKVFATASPFHHIAGVGTIAVAIAAGATAVPVPSFGLETWRSLAELGTTHALLVPTMVDVLLDEGLLALPGLETLCYGAAPVLPDTVARVLRELPGARLVQFYGQTEGSPITCLTMEDHLSSLEDRVDLLCSVGRAVPGVELRLAHPDAHGVGEVCARGAHLGGSEPDGWLRTGDLGRLDDDGYLFLAGRAGDMIVRGGENVYPLEVERALAEHPAVRDVAVTGVTDRRLGEAVKAFVVVRDAGSPPTSEELREFARARLAGYKVPTVWELVADLPRNANGKLVRRELESRGATRARPVPDGGAAARA